MLFRCSTRARRTDLIADPCTFARLEVPILKNNNDICRVKPISEIVIKRQETLTLTIFGFGSKPSGGVAERSLVASEM